ncbi:MAG: hypothetical protein ACYS0G_03035 [Planctomycetota bacterium]
MNDAGPTAALMHCPSPAEAEGVVAETRRLFRRTLGVWVCDLLTLRRDGLRRPCWRAPGSEGAATEAG